MAADSALTGKPGLRLGGIFALFAGLGGIYAVMDGKTVAEAIFVAISAGFLVSMGLGILLLLLIFAGDMIANLIAGIVLIVWVSTDWRNRRMIAARLQAAEQRWVATVADGIAAGLRWLGGKKP
ncbi:hypothetical protein CUV01_02960 [Paracoccus tegillarcae]|uniref:Uncharacterized protein n=2 Tax=Paracoccus tegillarcae TaxID=1529068 RepID=A0A2K9EP51_9RHOB|nr:hypothetical protein CUV01_02960 [Paracoccus tegillarcae]